MTYLALDPQRIRRLRGALADVAVALSRQRSQDPLAADALRAARAAHDALAFRWLVVLDRVIACRALEAGAWHGVEGMVARGLLAGGYAVQSAADEPGVAGISITETKALVEGLGRADLGALLASAGERAALQEMLQRILADPQSTAAFVTEFDRWPALLDVLAEHRQLALARDEPTGEIDALIDRVAALIDAHPQRGRLLGELSAHGQPYAVALVLVRVHIDPVQFGVLAAELLRRWSGDLDVDVYAESGQSLGAYLIPFVAASPVAARALFGELGRSPDPLAATVTRTEDAVALLRAATDPATTTLTQAATILAMLIDAYGARAADWDLRAQFVDWPAVLAAAAAPWLPIFGPQAEDAGWTTADGRRRLDVLVDRGGAEALADAEAAWVPPLLAALREPDGSLNRDVIDDLTGTLALLDDRLRQGEITADARDRAMIAPVLAVIDQLPRLLSVANPAAQLGARTAAKAATDTVEDLLRDWGVLPPGERESAARADRRWSTRTTQAEVILFVAVAEQMIAAGELPRRARAGLDLHDLGPGCAAEEVRRRLTTFIDTYATGQAAERLWAVRNAMLNDPTVTVACR